MHDLRQTLYSHIQRLSLAYHDQKQTGDLRKRKESLHWINELTSLLARVWAVRTLRQAETARRLAVETWLQRSGAVTVSQNPKVLPVFSENFAHN